MLDTIPSMMEYADPAPDIVVRFDDVLTGLNFKGIEIVLGERFPGVTVFGLFLRAPCGHQTMKHSTPILIDTPSERVQQLVNEHGSTNDCVGALCGCIVANTYRGWRVRSRGS